jgi:predicted permease
VPDLLSFHNQLLRNLGTIPDVVSAGAVNWRPFGLQVVRGDIAVDGERRVSDDYNVTKASVSPGYFRTMGIRLSAGRDFDDRDDATSPGVVVVSSSVAGALWPHEDPLGKRLALTEKPTPRDWLTVVGVADDIRQNSLKQAVVPTAYRPLRQTPSPGFLSHMSYVVRTDGDPMALAPALRGALQAVDKDQAPQSIVPLADVIASTIADSTFYTRLLAVLSSLALFLASIGIYGVLTSAVAERRREIGIRVALGADKAAVVRMVLAHTLRLAVTGLALGLATALALTGLLKTLLFEVTPTDAVTFAGSAALLLGVALLSGLLPARRASAADPLVVLRSL